mgnify:CR=1 FL=1
MHNFVNYKLSIEIYWTVRRPSKKLKITLWKNYPLLERKKESSAGHYHSWESRKKTSAAHPTQKLSTRSGEVFCSYS